MRFSCLDICQICREVDVEQNIIRKFVNKCVCAVDVMSVDVMSV